MRDVMLDLETLGTGKDGAIIQIGACYFDRHTGEIGNKFKQNISLKSAVEAGGVIDPDTVVWWMSQSAAAQASVLIDPQDCTQVLNELNAFLKPCKAIWSHATFDFPILMSAMRRSKVKPNFSFRDARDIRTLQDLTGVGKSKIPRQGVHHDALDDCIYQVAYCVEAFNALKEQK